MRMAPRFANFYFVPFGCFTEGRDKQGIRLCVHDAFTFRWFEMTRQKYGGRMGPTKKKKLTCKTSRTLFTQGETREERG
jgi:hypothetical protein